MMRKMYILMMVLMGISSYAKAESAIHGHQRNHSRFILVEHNTPGDVSIDNILMSGDYSSRQINTTLTNHLYKHFDEGLNKTVVKVQSVVDMDIRRIHVKHKSRHSKFIVNGKH